MLSVIALEILPRSSSVRVYVSFERSPGACNVGHATGVTGKHTQTEESKGKKRHDDVVEPR